MGLSSKVEARKIWLAVAMLAAMLLPGLALALDRGSLTLVDGAARRHTFRVEVASKPEDLTRGLMFRRSLDADAGMLFDFGRPQRVSMWMKDTFIPLDMLFIDENGTVLGIAERTVPQSLAVISSPGPVRAVLEVNGGTASRLGLRAGDRVEHEIFGRR